jgi:DNA polymerase V
VRPTADTAELMRAVETAVRTQFRPGFRYAKAGAVLSELQAAGHEQGELDLFSSGEHPATPAPDPRARLMHAMDTLNNRFGRDSVRIGSTAMASRSAEVAVWATKQERRTPRYTTRWDEMPTVRA